MFPEETLKLAQQVVTTASAKGKKIATAESCTGGLISGVLTEISGSSACVDRSFVTYSNEAKMELLGVNPETLEKYGAVCRRTAKEMSVGARELGGSDIAISVTGIAGPGGGSVQKPVGLVYLCLCTEDGYTEYKDHFTGNRQEVRIQTINTALNMILDALNA